VLVAQLGRRLGARLRERRADAVPEPDATAPAENESKPLAAEPGRAFAIACLAADVSMLTIAALVAALARRSSHVPLPPDSWIAAFAALTLGLHWSWRLYTFRAKLRPVLDSLLIAGATSLAAMIVFTIRSLAGESGVGDELLPLWAFTAVYGVAGRMGFYLAWTARTLLPEPDAG
jgi:FlaA1/EpsC-like NDP-sugar epimerase